MAELKAGLISVLALGPRFSVVGAFIFIAVDMAAPSSLPSAVVLSDLIESVLATADPLTVSLVVSLLDSVFAVEFTLKN